jgi:hypothetical protein
MVEWIRLKKDGRGEKKGIACLVHTLREIDLGKCRPHDWA